MPSTLTHADIEDLFTYHAPKPGQPERYQAVRDAAKQLAFTIVLNTPPGDDQNQALRHLRSSTMFANAAIALEKGPTT